MHADASGLGHARDYRRNGRFPYTGTTGNPAKTIASANGCTDPAGPMVRGWIVLAAELRPGNPGERAERWHIAS